MESQSKRVKDYDIPWLIVLLLEESVRSAPNTEITMAGVNPKANVRPRTKFFILLKFLISM